MVSCWSRGTSRITRTFPICGWRIGRIEPRSRWTTQRPKCCGTWPHRDQSARPRFRDHRVARHQAAPIRRRGRRSGKVRRCSDECREDVLKKNYHHRKHRKKTKGRRKKNAISLMSELFSVIFALYFFVFFPCFPW